MALPNAAERTQSDLAHLIHPLYHPTDHQEPRIWVEGRGALMKDINGVEVIDGLGGLWNVNIGHGRRELGAAAMQQMNTLAYCSSYTGASNLPAIELAERLSRIVYPPSIRFSLPAVGPSPRRVRSRRRVSTGKRKANPPK
jgi:adenosylmethionine-8-amino-7-oxononanoate aminotransferase